LVSAPATAGPLQAWLAVQPRGGVLELPLPDSTNLPGRDAEYAYLSTFHWQPMVNGYSGNVPPHYMRLLRALESAGAVDASEVLRNAGVRYVVVHASRPAGSPDPAWVARLDQQPAVARHGPFASPLGAAMVYDLAKAHD
jgi:hypothetical protein